MDFETKVNKISYKMDTYINRRIDELKARNKTILQVIATYETFLYDKLKERPIKTDEDMDFYRILIRDADSYILNLEDDIQKNKSEIDFLRNKLNVRHEDD